MSSSARQHNRKDHAVRFDGLTTSTEQCARGETAEETLPSSTIDASRPFRTDENAIRPPGVSFLEDLVRRIPTSNQYFCMQSEPLLVLQVMKHYETRYLPLSRQAGGQSLPPLRHYKANHQQVIEFS